MRNYLPARTLSFVEFRSTTPPAERIYAKLTRFSYPLANATSQVIADASGTIEEHHPGEIVWVQHVWSKATLSFAITPSGHNKLTSKRMKANNRDTCQP